MNSHYYELTVSPSKHPHLFLDFVNEVFSEPVEERDNSIILRSSDALDDISWAIDAYAKALSEALDEELSVSLKLEEKKNEDWIKKYQEGVAPVELGSFYIHPSWYEAKPGKKNILIDPALAFGSGHHPTTANCLVAIEKYVRPDMHIIDVGCGSGILAIASAKMGARVDVCDTDREAIVHSKENFIKNGVHFENIWEGSIHQAASKYELIIANIVADVLGFIASDIYKKLEDEGLVILSGILDKYETQVVKSYKKLNLVERIVTDEWVTLIMKKEGN